MHSAATRAQPDADATFEVGTLVRVRNASSAFHDMTGEVVEHDGFMPSCVFVKMTSTWHVLRFNRAELVDARGGR